MAVPEAVKRQAEEADKALEAFANAKKEHSDQPAAAEAPVKEDMEETQPGQKEEPEAATQTDEVMALRQELDLERQRNRTLQGRIDSQLSKANSENKELKATVEAMEAKLEEMSKANAVPGSRRLLSEDEINDLGEDVLGMQERIIKGTLEEELESGKIKEVVNNLIEQSMKVQREQVSESGTSEVNERLFWQAVERYYPGAEKLNSSDSGWFAFLDMHDPETGLKNRELGNRAFATGDFIGLADLMKTYKPEGHVVSQPPKAQVKPERTGSQPIVTEAKKTWKHSEVQKFFEDVARKRFSGSREEAEAIERDIMEAAQEGRITA
jgi:hypothetical protein